MEPLPALAGSSNEREALSHDYALNGWKTALLQREYAAMAKETWSESRDNRGESRIIGVWGCR